VTRLEAFIQSNGIRPAHLAREAGISRKHLWWLRMGRAEPTRIMMVRIAAGCSHILQRNVEVSELFAVGG
jgi:transcriptional regulator with XRE-family HTH domain